MEKINLRLTIEETNMVLEALGNLPFSRVYNLIGKIQEQAEQQIGASGGKKETADGTTTQLAEE